MVFHKLPVKTEGYDQDLILKNNRDVNDEKLDNHIVRARSKIFEYVACNDFDYFITLTLNKEKYDRYDLREFIKDLGQFIRDYRKKYKVDIQYLLIPEPHKDGAWHMHGVIKGIPGSHLIINKNGYLDWTGYSDKFGWCSIDPIRSREAISKYMTKYASKALVASLKREKEKKLYYVTRGLKTAEKVKEGTLTSDQLERITFDYENDYIKAMDLNALQHLKIIDQLDQLNNTTKTGKGEINVCRL